MNIFLIITLSIITIALGVIGYLEKIAGRKIRHVNYYILLVIFIIVSVFSLYRQITSATQMSVLELKANHIQSIQLYVSINATTPKQPLGDKETSTGVSSVVALFSKDNVRYRFITNFQFSTQQVSENMCSLMFVYEPEDPTQLYGKPISFLKSMTTFACDYSSFFQTTGFDPGSTDNYIDIIVFINGVDTMVIHKNSASGVLSGGQAVSDISKEFANITNAYSERLRNKLSDK